MKAIWKYPLNIGHKKETKLFVPINAKILHVDMPTRKLNIWFEIDNENKDEVELRKFYTMHTGSIFDDNRLQFIKTVICTPTYVLHVYEKIKEKFLTNDDMRL